MISFVVCSKNLFLLEQVVISIKATVGVPNEIVSIDNRKNDYSICTAYNLGAKQSKYNVLCFIHEDILFHTKDWGPVLVKLLEKKEVGLVGMIGGIYKSRIPSGWWDIPQECKRMNLLQLLGDGTIRSDFINPEGGAVSEVVTLDGVFLAMRKEVWQEYQFNEQEIKGFHFYDLDLSLRIKQKYKLLVSHQILIEHFSEGNINRQWVEYAFEFHRKWYSHLPTHVSNFELFPLQYKLLEYKACKALVNYCITNNCSIKTIAALLFQCFRFQFFNKDNMWLMKKYFKSKIIFR